jgi:uncharacterized protein YceH (UPF0502 family)
MLAAVELTATEARVIGSLIEKQMTTPQYYPLTLNALVTACNQTSNRNPVVSYDARLVEETVDGLKLQGLVRVVHSPSNRAIKYRQVLEEAWSLDDRQLALLGVLMLRGPQTLGELRARTERMAEMIELAEVEMVLNRLASRDEPLVVRLARQPGQKEARYAHLLSGPVAADADHQPDPRSYENFDPSGDENLTRTSRVEELATEVASLRDEVAQLREWVDAIRSALGEP